jgi:hypothetical protein
VAVEASSRPNSFLNLHLDVVPSNFEASLTQRAPAQQRVLKDANEKCFLGVSKDGLELSTVCNAAVLPLERQEWGERSGPHKAHFME